MSKLAYLCILYFNPRSSGEERHFRGNLTTDDLKFQSTLLG